MKTKNKTKYKTAYLTIKCSLCGELLNFPQDLVLYNLDENDFDTITELEFRHQNKRDASHKIIGGCDDKRFRQSRHVVDGYDDLIKQWEISPYNPKNKEILTQNIEGDIDE